MRAFLSYQTQVKVAAGRVRKFLEDREIAAFLAHEVIEVSQEWAARILDELAACDLFVAVLSESYFASPFCVQESGIAVFRKIPIMPLSLDGTIPRGFLSHIQSSRIDPLNIDARVMYAGIAKCYRAFAIAKMIDDLSEAGSYRSAEACFALLSPYLQGASDEQIVRVLEVAASNGQISNASKCITEFLPPLLVTHIDKLRPDVRQSLIDTLSNYQVFCDRFPEWVPVSHPRRLVRE